MPKRHTKIPRSQDEPFDGGDENFRECNVCHQEFTGLCPLNSATCPCLDGGEGEEDEDDDPDFDDVDNLGEILEEDKEVEKLLDEDDEEIPAEDLEEDEDK